MTGPFEIPMLTLHFDRHNEVKQKMLKLIETSNNGVVTNDNGDNITKCDYYVDAGKEREYWSYLYPIINQDLTNVFNNVIKYNEWKISNYWFQQYTNQDTHTWHWHDKCFYQCVYYLELPEGSPATEVEIPITGQKWAPKVKEGDIFIFPTILRHRSPPIQSDLRKTIIAINIE